MKHFHICDHHPWSEPVHSGCGQCQQYRACKLCNRVQYRKIFPTWQVYIPEIKLIIDALRKSKEPDSAGANGAASQEPGARG